MTGHVDEPAPAPGTPPVTVMVRGQLRGRELAGRWTARVTSAALQLATDAPDDDADASCAPLAIPLDEINGVETASSAGSASLVLHLRRGDVLEIAGIDGDAAAPRALHAAFEAAVADVGEVMREVRAAGSRRARPGSDHDRFFRPLLEARLALAAASGIDARLAAVSAPALRARLDAAIGELARERFPEEPSDRRALEAELRELTAPAAAALDRLEMAATAARAAPAASRHAAWRAWRVALAAVYVAADRAWLAALPALADSRGAEGRGWRRLLRRGPRPPGELA